MSYQDIFNHLWDRYTKQNPATQKVYNLFLAEGEVVINDHIAFRTFQHSSIGIDQLARHFLENGYLFKGDYHFDAKKLYAKHFEHYADPEAPRVFISELKIDQCSLALQHIVNEWIDRIPSTFLSSPELINAGNLSGQPSFSVYEKLRLESEYAAWLYVNGFCANHFTVSVNHLKKYDTLQKVNQFLKSNGLLLNSSGGEIQGTPEELLEQSSIKAGMIPVSFSDGVVEIPGCYYEFARRYPDKDGRLYSGFIAKSADKIFESTDFYKK